MIKAVIFDMDGVIADTGELHFKAWQEFLKKYGKLQTKDEFKKYFGMINFEIFRLLLPEAKKKDYSRLNDEKEAIYRKYAKKELKALPGAKLLIKKLHESGIKLGVGSSGHPKNVIFNLRKLKLIDFFDKTVSSDEVTKGKPDPEVFLKVAKKLEVKPQECVVIEDAYHGVEAAKRGYMKVIAVTNTHSRDKLSKADIIIDSLAELSLKKILELGND